MASPIKSESKSSYISRKKARLKFLAQMLDDRNINTIARDINKFTDTCTDDDLIEFFEILRKWAF